MSMSSEPMVDSATAPQTNRLKREIVAFSPLFVMLALTVYCAYLDSCSSPVFVQYAPVIWIPLALCLFLLVATKGLRYNVKQSVWRRIPGYLIFLLLALYFTRTGLLYGSPALFKTISGEPFEVRTTVVSKSWIRRPQIHVANYYTILKGIAIDKSLWKELEVG